VQCTWESSKPYVKLKYLASFLLMQLSNGISKIIEGELPDNSATSIFFFTNRDLSSGMIVFEKGFFRLVLEKAIYASNTKYTK